MKIVTAVLLTLAFAATASATVAVAPTLTKVIVQNRHPDVTFSAPNADQVAVYFANKPDRATDGSFLQENIVDTDVMTDDEIQAGHWLSDRQLDPGTYYVLLDASPNFEACWRDDTSDYDPACANGYSELATLVVPMPTIRYSVTVTRESLLGRVELELRASPLGIKQPYKVCYLTAAKKKRCLTGTLDGFDWDSSTDDSLEVATKTLAQRTKFTWTVAGKTVLAKTIKVK